MSVSEKALILLNPLPLERLDLHEDLSGRYGNNRALAHVVPQISAQNDLEAIKTWLLEFANSPQTQRTYRKEAERLLLWTLIDKQKAFSSLNRDDLRDYEAFLKSPTPFEHWCGIRRPRSHPAWKPFEKGLSPESIHQAMTIINALFSYLVNAGFLAGNPLSLRRHKRSSHESTKKVERFLEQSLWAIVVDYIQQLPQQTPTQKKYYERIRFLFSWLYGLGPRVSEMANTNMSDIHAFRGQWWWTVTGKGNKTEKIPVTESLLQSLIRYRHYYGLASLPSSSETLPLFMSLNGKKGVTANMIYRLVKEVFLNCAKSVACERPEMAEKLQKASTHWLRHTAITHQTDAGIDLRYIQRTARHASVNTTLLYQHAEEERWHEAMTIHQQAFGLFSTVK